VVFLVAACCCFVMPRVVVAVRFDDKAAAAAWVTAPPGGGDIGGDDAEAAPHEINAEGAHGSEQLRSRHRIGAHVINKVEEEEETPTMADLVAGKGVASTDDFGVGDLEAAYGSSRGPEHGPPTSASSSAVLANRAAVARMWFQLHQEAYNSTRPTTMRGWIEETLFAIGGGTGATVGGTGDPEADEDMVRRMRYQDKAVMVFLLLTYAASLLFSANIAYRQATNTSPVTYYADPRYHSLVTDATDADQFLDTFNQPPKDVFLQVTGFVALQDPQEVAHATREWYGVLYHVAFSFALDLSPWVVCGTSNPQESMQGLGISVEDHESLAQFLSHSTNDLAMVEIDKQVLWHDWEELATNIKQRIRQSGFGGIISVHRSSSELVTVYKNKTWANFMHSRTTKVLWALSLVGWLFYQPYMWWRCTSTKLSSRYRVDISIAQYWPFIAEKIGADGFDEAGGLAT